MNNNITNNINQMPNKNSTPTTTNIQVSNVNNQTPNINQPQIVTQTKNNIDNNQLPKKKKKSHGKTFLILILLFIIGGMTYYIFMDYQKDLKTKCSPLVPMNNKTRKLDINSTLVQDLYSKVKTNIREDIANTDLNDEMKLYLAYRQLPKNKIYESNCNLFNNTSMTSVTCIKSESFIPNAFKEEDLQLELKKLFGEDTNIENNNIQLGNSCLGSYQYIAERGEYVEGSCNSNNTSIYNVDKKLLSASVTNDVITLKEKVRYYGSESVNIDRLKNGIYVYTFKLDNNYNYVYVNRSIEEN